MLTEQLEGSVLLIFTKCAAAVAVQGVLFPTRRGATAAAIPEGPGERLPYPDWRQQVRRFRKITLVAAAAAIPDLVATATCRMVQGQVASQVGRGVCPWAATLAARVVVPHRGVRAVLAVQTPQVSTEVRVSLQQQMLMVQAAALAARGKTSFPTPQALGQMAQSGTS